MKIKLHPVKLPLRHPFTIARSSTTVQKSLIVELSHQGLSGYGEATANGYYNTTISMLMQQVESVRDAVESETWQSPEELHARLQATGSLSPFAICALDEACHDLHGKLKGQPLHRLWGLNPAAGPVSNYTLGLDTIEMMVQKMKEMPWPIYKIKLGTSHDLKIVEELRKHTHAVLRVDANCAWGVDETIKNSFALKRLRVELIEQPMPAEDVEGMKRVFANSALPVLADESCRVEEDVDKCYGHFHGINIKLTKCGGLTPARRMIARARELSLSVMMGCMTESSVGISAIAQVAPLLDYVDMDGALLITDDPASGVQVTPGGLVFPDENGTGARLRQPVAIC